MGERGERGERERGNCGVNRCDSSEHVQTRIGCNAKVVHVHDAPTLFPPPQKNFVNSFSVPYFKHSTPSGPKPARCVRLLTTEAFTTLYSFHKKAERSENSNMISNCDPGRQDPSRKILLRPGGAINARNWASTVTYSRHFYTHSGTITESPLCSTNY